MAQAAAAPLVWVGCGVWDVVCGDLVDIMGCCQVLKSNLHARVIISCPKHVTDCIFGMVMRSTG